MFRWNFMESGSVVSHDTPDAIEKLKKALAEADAVLIGAGAGLSTSAGFVYTGERLKRYFGDFTSKYGFRDMYSGGFYPYKSLEEQWGFWSRYIYINRYVDTPKDTYDKLLKLVRDKEYFVLTTNVDHRFQKAGFDKKRIFYTQGDYGLWQCSSPCHDRTYDNKERVVKMVLSQGFTIGADKELMPPVDENGETDFSYLNMKIPTDLIPYCPVCGEPMAMNLRADDTFVQDDGWYEANGRYEDFIRRFSNMKIVFLELGVGANTPVIIKYPFQRYTEHNKDATYVCINYNEAYCPISIEKQSIIINDDINNIVDVL